MNAGLQDAALGPQGQRGVGSGPPPGEIATPSARTPLRRRDLIALGAALVAGSGVSLWLRGRPRPERRLTLTPAVAAVLGDPGSPAAGPADAAVTLVVFTDYQCPICRGDEPALLALLADEPSVRLIFKDWPIRGERSQGAARAALAAGRQGRYLAMHQALMQAAGPLEPARLPALAAAAGVDWTQLSADLARDGPAIDAQLARHALQAFSLGLSGTPAYVVEPYLYEGAMSPRRMRAALRLARRTGGPARELRGP